jgi:diguanylate cyclase (GGDEF)-like protein/PAS domain S-box-containing protein
VLGGSAVVVIGLAVAVALSAAERIRDSAVDAAIDSSASIVRGYLDPILTETSLDLGAVPRGDVNEQLARLSAGADIRRINVWTRDGLIMYSTEPALQGMRLGIDHELAEAFAGEPRPVFGSRGEASQLPNGLPEQYLEIFVPIRGTSDGNPIGVFELYQDAGPIERQVGAAQREIFLISLAAGSVLLGLLWLAFSGASRRLAQQNRRLMALNARLNTLAADLTASEARFRSLVQNSSDVVVVVGRRGSIGYESDAVRRVLGHEPELHVGRPFDELVHPDDAARARSLLAGLGDTRDGAQAMAELRMQHADGSWRWVETIGQNRSHDPAVGGVVLNFRDVTDRRSLEEQLRHEALHDPLTGLANRALFADRVAHALTRTSRAPDDRVAVLIVDLDDFKDVNDSLGHAAGDELLTAVAERIRACLRRQDTPSRLGGDEFGILLEDTDGNTAAAIAERILEALRQPFALGARQLVVQASIGIAQGGGAAAEAGSRVRDGQSADELLRNADAAMYTAKARGKARHEFYEARMHATALRRLDLRERLEAALEANAFVLHYQPVVDLADGSIAGVEALVRWPQPNGDILPPAEFVPLAEESGQIVPLGRWVLQEATRQAARWRKLMPASQAFSMAVNVASRQLQDANFHEVVAATLRRARLAPGDLVLEVTESALLDDGEATADNIARLKAAGIRLALDDFGTGYSSLSHLRRFPIDQLKIDRSFVSGIDEDAHGERALVRSIIRLAGALDLETVAEGIEKPEQVARLRALGASLGQGYHFARPMEAAALTRLLRRGLRTASARPA